MKEYWQNRIKEMVEEYHRVNDPMIRLALIHSIQVALRIVKEAP